MSFGELSVRKMSFRGNARSGTVLQGNVRRENVFGELSVSEKSFGEKSVGKRSIGNCPDTECQRAKLSNILASLKTIIINTHLLITFEKCPNTEFFWSVFPRIWTEYGNIRTSKNSVFGHFLCNECITNVLNLTVPPRNSESF